MESVQPHAFSPEERGLESDVVLYSLLIGVFFRVLFSLVVLLSLTALIDRLHVLERPDRTYG